MEGIQYKSLIIKLVDKQRFITENPCVTGSIPVGTTKKGLVKTSLFLYSDITHDRDTRQHTKYRGASEDISPRVNIMLPSSQNKNDNPAQTSVATIFVL